MKGKIVLLLFLGSLSLGLTAAPQPEQSHNLSEIHPIDVDFNMSEKDIFNVTRFELVNGLTLEGSSIRDSGNTDRIRVNPNGNGKVIIPNSDLNVTDGNAEFQGTISADKSSPHQITVHSGNKGDFLNTTRNDIYVSDGSHPAYPNDWGNLILESPNSKGSIVLATSDQKGGGGSIQTTLRAEEAGNVAIPNGILNMHGNRINRIPNIDSNTNMRLDIDSNNDNSGKQFIISKDGGRTDLINVKESGNAIIPNGKLKVLNTRSADFAGTSIISKKHIEFESGNPALITRGGGSDEIRIFDNKNNQDIARFQEGGVLEVPNNNLVVNNSNRVMASDGNNRKTYLYHDSSNGRIGTNWGNLHFDTGDGSVPLKIINGGPVQLNNANLDMAGNNVTNIDTLKFEEGTSIDGNLTVNGSVDTTGDIDLQDNDLIEPDELRTGGSGSDDIAVRDAANSQDIARFNEGGAVEVPNGNLQVSSGYIGFQALEVLLQVYPSLTSTQVTETVDLHPSIRLTTEFSRFQTTEGCMF